jgi:hypothetical protein
MQETLPEAAFNQPKGSSGMAMVNAEIKTRLESVFLIRVSKKIEAPKCCN